MMIRSGSDEASHAGRNVPAAAGTGALSVFIADDDSAVAELLTDFVSDIGHRIAAVETSHAGALAVADSVAADLAILDINLHGRPSFAIADRLTARGIPVIFATGFGILELSGKYADAVLLKKPFRVQDLAQAIAGATTAKVRPVVMAPGGAGAWRDGRKRGAGAG